MTNWEVKYNILKNIHDNGGSINDIHQEDVIEVDGVIHKIGSFLSDQRKLYNKYLKLEDKKKDKKVLEHIRLLDELGLDWNPKESEWLSKYRLLVDYKNKFGDLNVPYTYEVDGFALGVFVANQRSIYRRNIKKDNIDEKLLEHFKMLEELGIIWDIQELEWQMKYNALKEYYKLHGNINLDEDIIVNINGKDASLRKFILNQRSLYKKYINGEIQRDEDSRLLNHFSLLNEIGMDWYPNMNEWLRKYQLLVSYKEEFGNIDVPYAYSVVIDGKKINLGDFLVDQRELYRNNRNTTDEILLSKFKLLEDLGIVWSPLDEYWNLRYELIKKYKEKYGNCNIKYDYVVNYNGEDINLGRFICKQRELYKKHKKNNFSNTDSKVMEHFKMLEDIGVSFNPMKDEWMRQYNYFLKYYERFGHLNIPNTYVMVVDGKTIKIGQMFRNQQEALTKRKDEILSGTAPLEVMSKYYSLKEIGFNFSNRYDSLIYDFGDGEKTYTKKSLCKRASINVRLFSKYYYRFNGNITKAIKVCRMINDLKMRRRNDTLKEFLDEFEINEEVLRKYLDKTSVKEVDRSNEVIMYKDGVSLRKYCIDNGYNYGVIMRALKLKQKKLVDEDLDTIINRVISDYKLKGQNVPSTWIYSKYGNQLLLRHFLLSLGLDPDAILRDMTHNCITMEEAICKNSFKRINNRKYDYLEELYYLVCKRFDELNHDSSINPSIAVESITMYIENKVKEYSLNRTEYEVLINSLFKYIETVNRYHIFDVGFEKDEVKKQEKIREYLLDEEEIEESFYIPLQFDNKVLIGRDSELYGRRMLLKDLVHSWDNYSEDEKINYIRKHGITDEELKFIYSTRDSINTYTKKREIT